MDGLDTLLDFLDTLLVLMGRISIPGS